MKTLKKTGWTYNSSKTLSVSPELDSFSYDWYMLGKKLNDHVYIVNNYSYSTTTVKHKYKMMRFIESKMPDVKFVYIEAPKGLNNLNSALEHNVNMIENCERDLANPRKRETTKAALRLEVKKLIENVTLIKMLQAIEE